jgi:hypothetical protein
VVQITRTGTIAGLNQSIVIDGNGRWVLTDRRRRESATTVAKWGTTRRRALS